MARKIIIQGRPFTFQPSGNKTFTTNFVLQLSKRLSGYNIEILLPEEIDMAPFSLPSNCVVKIIPKIETTPPYLSTLLWETQQMTEYLASVDGTYECFLSTHPSLPIAPLRSPTYVVVHDVHLWKEPHDNWTVDRKLTYEINKQSIMNARTIFTVSDFTMREAKEYFGPSCPTIASIYEDIDPYYTQSIAPDTSYIQSLGLDTHDYYLYIGSFEPRKNLDALMKAYDMYRTHGGTKKLVVVGAATQRSKEAAEQKLHDSIIWKETATIPQLYQLYASAQAFVYPSNYEGFGLQILEAQHTGCVVLCSDIPVFREVAGEGALFFDQHSPESICRTLETVEKNSDQHESIIKKGRENAHRYSWEHTIDLFIKNQDILKP